MDRTEKLHRLAASARWITQVDADLLARDVAEDVILAIGDRLDPKDADLIRAVARAASRRTMHRVRMASRNAMADAWPTSTA